MPWKQTNRRHQTHLALDGLVSTSSSVLLERPSPIQSNPFGGLALTWIHVLLLDGQTIDLTLCSIDRHCVYSSY